MKNKIKKQKELNYWMIVSILLVLLNIILIIPFFDKEEIINVNGIEIPKSFINSLINQSIESGSNEFSICDIDVGVCVNIMVTRNRN